MVEVFDVVIIGAGISGIGVACHLRKDCPNKKILILESKETFGGTWHTHTYPGVRSDSDLFTFGYAFKPWTGVAIAKGEEIMKYLGEVIEENGLQPLLRYRHKVVGCNYSTTDHQWSIEVNQTQKDGSQSFHIIKSSFLLMCAGYYDHDRPHTPQWPNMEQFGGIIVHPQKWPKDINLKEKKVIVIGSGATAATVVPAIAGTCAHVTMLQRSPTYFTPGKNFNDAAGLNPDDLAAELRRLGVDDVWIHDIMRRKYIRDGFDFVKITFEQPEVAKNMLLSAVKAHLPENFDMKHFTPKYRPWQQRLAVVPDGDLFKAISKGEASVVTDEIVEFTKEGIRIQSTGEVLPADIIVTATGFHLTSMGNIPYTIDGKPIVWSETITYRGMMCTQVPNFVNILGYFRVSWTMRVHLIGDFVCRLLHYMDEHHFQEVVPRLREEDRDMPFFEYGDETNFNANYLKRGIDLWPKRGNKIEWCHIQDFVIDSQQFPSIDFGGEEFEYK